jgi:hypothetical protein
MLAAAADKRLWKADACWARSGSGVWEMRRFETRASGVCWASPASLPMRRGMIGEMGRRQRQSCGGAGTEEPGCALEASDRAGIAIRESRVRSNKSQSQEIVDEMKLAGCICQGWTRWLLGFCQDDRRIVGSEKEEDARIRRLAWEMRGWVHARPGSLRWGFRDAQSGLKKLDSSWVACNGDGVQLVQEGCNTTSRP